VGDLFPNLYQDDFETPGISPRNARPRKHSRQIPNLRKYARGRPHNLQRLCRREENFGLGSLPRAKSNFFSIFASFTRFAVVNLPFTPGFRLGLSSQLSAVSSQNLIKASTLN
jgi:hypothetical protein